MKNTELQKLLIDLCAQQQEEPWLEFKCNYISPDEIGEYISALSNGATISNKPFGYLIWGVEDVAHSINMENFDSWEDEIFLDKAKITINGKITNTAVLLLGKPESVHYILPSVAEITWKLDAEQKAYEHFYPPFLLSTTNVYRKIRNYRFKIFPDNQLFPVEINRYESRVVLEALHNCIAHQDYRLNSRIIVAEQADVLVFENAGSFFEGQPEDYFEGKKTPQHYRNKWLAQAMVSLNMIDSLGYGIYMINTEQRKRFMPLSDYILNDKQKVVLRIYGNVIDEKYSKLLMERADLSLMKVMLLDKVQKKQPLTDEAIALLRKEGLIEGRKPNIFISADLAKLTGKQVLYTKKRPFEKQKLKDWVLKFLKEHHTADRKQIDDLLWNLLPEEWTDSKKKNKIANLLSEMRREGSIVNKGQTNPPCWIKKTL